MSSHPDRTGGASRALLRRPNGRPQACDPCRRRKIACDHTHPVCQRCKKAKRAAQCEYIVDPQMSILLSPIQTPSSPSPRHSARNSTLLTTTAATTTTAAPSSAASPTSSSAQQQSRSAAAEKAAGVGYLGYTSFSGIYEETESSLSILGSARPGRDDAETANTGPVHATPPASTTTTTTTTTTGTPHVDLAAPPPASETLPSLSPHILELCKSVLRRIPARDPAEKAMVAYKNIYEGWAWRALPAVLDLVYGTFGSYLGHGDDRNDIGEDQEEGRLSTLSRIISRNTSRPLLDKDDYADWVAQFTGPDLRWEAVGMLHIFTALGASISKYRSDPLERCLRDALPSLPGSISACADICRSLNQTNVLTLYLVRQQFNVEMIFSGLSPDMGRYYHESIFILTYLGLHAQPNSDNDSVPYRPTIMSEIRRKLFIQSFTNDKQVACFVGRPPLLSRHYALTPPPLDLTDDELLSGPEVLAAAAARLTPTGWNPDNRISGAAISRARFMIALIRDEVLEVALGSKKNMSVDHLLHLLQKEEDLMNNLPSSILWDGQDATDPRFHEFFHSCVLLRLEHLQSVFFIRRLLIQIGHDSHADLVVVSYQMVSLTLLFWTHLERVPRVLAELEWMVMEYAAPPGGILCLELLRPTTTNTTQASTGATSRPLGEDDAAGSMPTRFEIIDKLFLLNGFLDWVPKGAPNSGLCGATKKVIRRVLERSMSGPPVAVPECSGLSSWNLDLEGTFIDFDFDLLDTFDWLRPETDTTA